MCIKEKQKLIYYFLATIKLYIYIWTFNLYLQIIKIREEAVNYLLI